MKTALAKIAMVLIMIFGLALMGVMKVLDGVMWVIKPFVMLWQQVRDAMHKHKWEEWQEHEDMQICSKCSKVRAEPNTNWL